MRRTLTIAKHELRMTAANKAFIIITIIGPFLIIAMSVIPSLVATGTGISEGTRIGVVGADSALEQSLAVALPPHNIEILPGNDFEAMKKLVLADEIQGILVVPVDYIHADRFQYFSKTGSDVIVIETLSGVLGGIVVARRLMDAGLNPALVDSLSRRPELDVSKIGKTGETEGGKGFMDIFTTSFSFVMLIYMTVLLYGQMIGRSVVTEKTSKTVEIMLSSATPRELMFGKILGIGSAGLIQYAFWISIALVLIKAVGPLLGISLPVSLTAKNLGYLVAFFIAAYILYSAGYAALGAASEDEQHLGQMAWPLLIFLIIPLLTMSSTIMNPYTPYSRFLSFFPMTSPIVMLARVLVEEPPLWELLLCFGILAVTIVLMVIVAAKIFRIGILMTGKRVRIPELVKWLRY